MFLPSDKLVKHSFLFFCLYALGSLSSEVASACLLRSDCEEQSPSMTCVGSMILIKDTFWRAESRRGNGTFFRQIAHSAVLAAPRAWGSRLASLSLCDDKEGNTTDVVALL